MTPPSRNVVPSPWKGEGEGEGQAGFVGPPPRGDDPAPDADTWVRVHRQTYDRMAVDYARRIDGYAAADEAERFVRRVRAHAAHAPLIADIGCGPGADAALLRLAGARTLAIDLSRAMLRVAAELERSPSIQADLRRVPLRAGCVDAVWCFAALGHVPPAWIGPVLREFRRVVTGGGWVYVVVRQGNGARQADWDGTLPRYFTDLQMPALRDALSAARLAVREHHIWSAASGAPWLHAIAQAA